MGNHKNYLEIIETLFFVTFPSHLYSSKYRNDGCL